MEKRVANKKEFIKAVKISSVISVILMLIFGVTSIVTGNWYFLSTAITSLFFSNGIYLIVLYSAYKKNENKTLT